MGEYRPPHKNWFNERTAPWVLLAPTLIVLTIVGLYPLLHSIWVSMTGLRPTNPTYFQGFLFLDNYAKALTSEQFWHAIGLTALFTVVSVSVSLFLGFCLSMVFNLDLPGFVVIRTAILIPMLLTPIAVGILWRIMYLPDFGILNYVLSFVGIEPLTWTGDKGTALVSVLLVDIWQWTPFMFLILFAGIRSMPKSPFESAQIDGASYWQTMRHVTLPLMKPIILIVVLLRGIDAIRTYDQVFILTRGGPDLATDIISLYIQRVNFKFFQIGYGAAVSWLLVIFILISVIIFIRWTGMVRQLEGDKM